MPFDKQDAAILFTLGTLGNNCGPQVSQANKWRRHGRARAGGTNPIFTQPVLSTHREYDFVREGIVLSPIFPCRGRKVLRIGLNHRGKSYRGHSSRRIDTNVYCLVVPRIHAAFSLMGRSRLVPWDYDTTCKIQARSCQRRRCITYTLAAVKPETR